MSGAEKRDQRIRAFLIPVLAGLFAFCTLSSRSIARGQQPTTPSNTEPSGRYSPAEDVSSPPEIQVASSASTTVSGSTDQLNAIQQSTLKTKLQESVDAAKKKLDQDLKQQATTLYRQTAKIPDGTALTAAQQGELDKLVVSAIQPATVTGASGTIAPETTPATPKDDNNQTPAAAKPEDQPATSLGGSERIKPTFVANIYRLAQAEWKDRISNDPALKDQAARQRKLQDFVEEKLAKAADIAKGDTTQLDEGEKKIARSIVEGVIEGKPAPALVKSDSRLTGDIAKTLLDETKDKSKAIALEGSVPGTKNHRDQLVTFAQGRAKELAKISDDLKESEKKAIENIVDLSEIPPSFEVPVKPRPQPDSGGQVAEVTPAVRDNVLSTLKKFAESVLPQFPGLDRKTGLIEFLKQNKDKLSIAESAAEKLVEQFLRENPSATRPTTPTTTNVTGTMMVQQPITSTPYILVPYGSSGHCLLRW